MEHEHGENSHATPTLTEPGTVFRGGTIRFADSTPELHVNNSHPSLGILPDSLEITRHGDLWFAFDVSLPVVSLWASPDETLSVRKIHAGISGGVSGCTVMFSRSDLPGDKKLNLNLPGHYNNLLGDFSNLWVGVVSYDAGK